MRNTLLPLTTLAFLSFSSISPQLQAKESTELTTNQTIITEITINFVGGQTSPSGKQAGNQQTIKESLQTKVGEPLSHENLDRDLKLLNKSYSASYKLVKKGKQTTLIFDLKPFSIIQKIEWEGNKAFSSKKLKSTLGIKARAKFDDGNFNHALMKVREKYLKAGFFEASVDYKTEETENGEIIVKVHIHEGRNGKVQNIVFEGVNDKSEEKKLLNEIKTKNYNFFTTWLTGDGLLNEAKLEDDQCVMADFLQNEGYASAKVKISLEKTKADKMLVRIIVDKGPRYKIGKVTIEGNDLYPENKLNKAITIKEGGFYSPEKIRKSAENIQQMYGIKGRIDAHVAHNETLVPGSNTYDVAFNIDSGKTYRIGLIHVVGNVQTQTHVILRESLLCPGERFNAAKLEGTKIRLQSMGYFKNVTVYAVKTDSGNCLGENYRDVFIDIEEGSTGSVSLFAGMSSGDSVSGGLDISEKNFSISGFSKLGSEGLSALRGGGQFAQARVTLGAKERTYLLSWVNPYVYDTLWRFGVNIKGSQGNLQSKDYDLESITFNTWTAYPLNAYWTYGVRYRLKGEHAGISNKGLKQEAEYYQTNNLNIPENLKKAFKERRNLEGNGIVSGIGTSLNFDSTDSAWKPHRGFRSGMDVELNGLGGRYIFLKAEYLNSNYFNSWKNGVWKFRYDFRFIFPTWGTHSPDKIPLGERFFLGGDTAVRGLRDYQIGPKIPGTNDPRGGVSSSLFTIEYLHQVFRPMDLFAYVDAGALSTKTFAFGQLKATAGIGMRLEVMNQIPIVLGYGWPLKRERGQRADATKVQIEGDELQQFFFSMGGQF